MRTFPHIQQAALTYRQDVLPADAAHVRAIIESSGFFSAEETAVAVELVEEHLTRKETSGYFFLFAEQEGQVVGYTCFGPIACTLHRYDLYWIAVHDRVRNQGIGHLLLRYSEDIICARGGRRLYVETSSRAQYAPTRQFYLRGGYQEAAVLPDFYAPDDSKVIYMKRLRPEEPA